MTWREMERRNLVLAEKVNVSLLNHVRFTGVSRASLEPKWFLLEKLFR